MLIDRCRQLPYVLFAHVSVSGEGVHLVVSCDNDSPDSHAFYFQSVCDAVSWTPWQLPR
ncbi:BT4734/BF3469 family protein [Parabacteroides chinchillae]|uniref:BT4734/BF3469 family protein n=1 Tax=Parabacteroides chinchillae TaxID=871327 RepID=UPI0011B05302|nr:BT4734/BF3469 family protein [Parabacteroides chinchillae]